MAHLVLIEPLLVLFDLLLHLRLLRIALLIVEFRSQATHLLKKCQDTVEFTPSENTEHNTNDSKSSGRTHLASELGTFVPCTCLLLALLFVMIESLTEALLGKLDVVTLRHVFGQTPLPRAPSTSSRDVFSMRSAVFSQQAPAQAQPARASMGHQRGSGG